MIASPGDSEPIPHELIDKVFKDLAKKLKPQQDQLQQLVQTEIQKLAEAVRPLQSEMIRQLADVFGRIDFEEMLKRGLPPNWAGLESAGAASETIDLIRETGWCLVWCPRASLINQLRNAPETEERTTILLNSRSLVIEDMRACLDGVDHGYLADNTRAARKAIDAFADGHFEAAQALAAAGISAAIGGFFGLKFAAARKKFSRDAMREPFSQFRRWTVLDMVARGLKTYYSEQGDPVPGEFSRHATAHSISPQQYTEVNSMASLLLLTAFLKEVEVLLDQRQAA